MRWVKNERNLLLSAYVYSRVIVAAFPEKYYREKYDCGTTSRMSQGLFFATLPTWDYKFFCPEGPYLASMRRNFENGFDKTIGIHFSGIAEIVKIPTAEAAQLFAESTSENWRNTILREIEFAYV